MRQNPRRKYDEIGRIIPWSSMGRPNVVQQVGNCLLPIGVFDPSLPDWQDGGTTKLISSRDADWEKYLMNIVGTSILTGTGKLATCLHVVDAIIQRNWKGYVLVPIKESPNTIVHTANQFDASNSIKYVRPGQRRFDSGVDLSVIPFIPRDDHGQVVDSQSIGWGDSTQLGIGDRVLIGGYPFGTDLFTISQTNRGIVQPSFFDGVVSAILPAQNERETRLIQLSTQTAGGMSGGVVFDPETGAAFGMLTSSLEDSGGGLLPVTYAIPSEVILPFSGSINYDSEYGRMGDGDPL